MKKYSCMIYNLFIFLIAVLFVIFVAKGESPLFPHWFGWDSSIFMYIGKGMKYGYVPYRDMYDIKGPLLWFIQYLGQVIYEGRNGIFIIEVITFSALLFFTFYIAHLYVSRLKAMVITLITLIFWRWGFGTGNACEIYSAVFSLAAVYITLSNKHSKVFDTLIGLLAMGALLIRFIDCIIVGSCIIYYVSCLLRQKRYKDFITYIICVGFGAVVILIPFICYYTYHNALMDMIDASLLFSIRYSQFNDVTLSKRLLSYNIFAVILSVIVIMKQRQKGKATLLLIMSVLCCVLYFIIGNRYNHYMLLSIPVIIISLTIIAESRRNLCILGMLIFMVVNAIYINESVRLFKEDIVAVCEMNNTETKQELFAEHISDIIPDADKDSVYTYMVWSYIPFLSDTFSNSKYFQAQEQYIADNKMQERIYKDFVEGSDKWVIINENNTNRAENILQYLYQNYSEYYRLDNYILYQRDNK